MVRTVEGTAKGRARLPHQVRSLLFSISQLRHSCLVRQSQLVHLRPLSHAWFLNCCLIVLRYVTHNKEQDQVRRCSRLAHARSFARLICVHLLVGFCFSQDFFEIACNDVRLWKPWLCSWWVDSDALRGGLLYRTGHGGAANAGSCTIFVGAHSCEDASGCVSLVYLIAKCRCTRGAACHHLLISLRLGSYEFDVQFEIPV